MRKLLAPSCAAALVFCGTFAGLAQDKSTASKESQEVQQNTKTMTNNGTSKTSSDTVYGKVDTYDAGKTLKVTVPGKIIQTKSFDLNSKDYTYNVAPNLKPGDWVSVKETTDANNHKTLTVEHSKRHSHAKPTT